MGRKPILLAGLAVFGVASAAAGLATTSEMMIAARLLAGVGAAMIMPVTLAVITSTFPDDERSKAIGVWTGIAGGGILGTTAVGVPHSHAPTPAAAQDTVPPGPQSMVNAATVTTVAQHQHGRAQAAPTVTVHRGATLWDIAAERLGSAQRWMQIYRLNTGRYRMRGGDHIEPG